ncbi:MAG: ParB/RepB/Spo0J family partition protein [Candidatus Dormibacteraeota bacterium]|nr:ParB/RepB/Spo0J family partition protein [Candidatus Dormibacteraeota bacterium]
MSRPRGRALGRGLEALIPIGPEGGPGGTGGNGIPEYIDVDQITASPTQMRRQFPAETLRELADSIRQHGILQPILVRRQPQGYELIAGERRWRAARMAGLERIPAIVRQEPEAEDGLLLGLIENLQREDLNPIEEAQGIQRLIEQFGLTHEEAAARLGKHRVAISQALRLLNGCPALVSATAAGAVSAGHARALVGLPSPEAQEQGLKAVLGRQLSVRQTERWVREYHPPRLQRRPAAEPDTEDPLAGLRRRLEERFGRKASVRGTASRGQLTIPYRSAQDLEDLAARLLDP